MAAPRYPIRIGRRSAPWLRVVFGVAPDRAWATVSEREVSARFGRFAVSVSLGNVTGWRIEGPWRWITAIGVRLSLRGGDVTFAGSPRRGVRLDFRERVRWTVFDVPAFYLGVDDLEGFAGELTAAGIDGVDARKP